MHRRVPIVENVPVARDTFRLRLADPTIAGSIRPGQFVMIRPGDGGSSDPLLGRPLALYDVVRDAAGECIGIDVVYLVIGRGTAALARRRPGERLSVWGPLGNGFGPPPEGPVIFVAGGIGQTPFLALGRDMAGVRAAILHDGRVALRRADGRTAGGRGRLPRGGDRGGGRDRRRDGRSPGVRHRSTGRAAWNAASGPPRSSAAGRRPCSRPSPG